jgi:hypothetical protein
LQVPKIHVRHLMVVTTFIIHIVLYFNGIN